MPKSGDLLLIHRQWFEALRERGQVVRIASALASFGRPRVIEDSRKGLIHLLEAFRGFRTVGAGLLSVLSTDLGVLTCSVFKTDLDGLGELMQVAEQRGIRLDLVTKCAVRDVRFVSYSPASLAKNTQSHGCVRPRQDSLAKAAQEAEPFWNSLNAPFNAVGLLLLADKALILSKEAFCQPLWMDLRVASLIVASVIPPQATALARMAS